MGRTSLDIDIALDNLLGREFADRINEYLKAHVRQGRGAGAAGAAAGAAGDAAGVGVGVGVVVVVVLPLLLLHTAARCHRSRCCPRRRLWAASCSGSSSQLLLARCGVHPTTQLAGERCRGRRRTMWRSL